jgi:hypothetical protein
VLRRPISASGRFCCKSPKLFGTDFFVRNIAPLLFSRLVTGPSAHGPAQRAGAQRLRALALFRRRRHSIGTELSEGKLPSAPMLCHRPVAVI